MRRSSQAIFCCEYVPVRVGERGGLGDEIAGRGLLVGAGGTDEDVLARPAAEKGDIALDVGGFEGDPIDYGIEGGAGERAGNGSGVFDVHGQRVRAGWRTGRVAAAVEERKIDAALDRQCVEAVLMMPVPPMKRTFIGTL
jgi:hypothetical protein